MNAQERQLLEDFLHQLASVQGLDKDPEADALIRQQSARQPDALYLTIQRSLLQAQALDAAQARIQALEQKVRELEAATPVAPPPAPRSFLSGLAGGWGRAPEPASSYPAAGSMIGSQVGQRAGVGYGAPTAPAPAFQAAPAPAAGGGMGGFLGTAAMTAAGVAGGMFLFNGIEHLMNGGSNAANMAGNLAGNTPVTENITENITENVTNNYGSDAASNVSGNQPDTTQVADSGDSGDSGGGWFDDGGFFDGGGDDDIV